MHCFSPEEQPLLPVSHNPKIAKKVFLPFGMLPPVTNFAEAVFPPGEKAGAHSHPDMTEIFLTRTGDGLITVDGHEIKLAAGTCVVAEPGETHEIVNTGQDNLIITYFGISTTRP